MKTQEVGENTHSFWEAVFIALISFWGWIKYNLPHYTDFIVGSIAAGLGKKYRKGEFIIWLRGCVTGGLLTYFAAPYLRSKMSFPLAMVVVFLIGYNYDLILLIARNMLIGIKEKSQKFGQNILEYFKKK